MRKDAPLGVHWVRHAKVASHEGDLPLTEEGRCQVEAAGRQFSRKFMPGEVVSLLHAPARRLLTFAVSLLDLPRVQPRRYICVTHSPGIRAFVRRYLLGHDPGEPGYLASVDLEFENDGSCTIQYQGVHKQLLL